MFSKSFLTSLGSKACAKSPINCVKWWQGKATNLKVMEFYNWLQALPSCTKISAVGEGCKCDHKAPEAASSAGNLHSGGYPESRGETSAFWSVNGLLWVRIWLFFKGCNCQRANYSVLTGPAWFLSRFGYFWVFKWTIKTFGGFWIEIS